MISPEGALVPVFMTLVDVLAGSSRSGGVALCAGALEPALNVGTRSIPAESRLHEALVVVDALVPRAVQFESFGTFAPGT